MLSRRSSLIVVLGVFCGGIALFAGISDLVRIAVQLRPLVDAWRAAARGLWGSLTLWLGFALPAVATTFLSFCLLAVMLAVGARLQSGNAAPVRLTAGRAAVAVIGGALACAVAYGIWIASYALDALGTSTTSDTVARLTYLALTGALTYACYWLLTRDMPGANRLFPIVVIYLFAKFLAPMLEIWAQIAKSEPKGFYESLGPSSRYSSENFAGAAIVLLLAPLLTSLLVAVMLSVAPAAVLRTRMLASLAITVALLLLSELLKLLAST